MRSDGWMSEELCVPGGSSAILVGSRARVVAPDQSERQQVPLVGSVVVVDEPMAQAERRSGRTPEGPLQVGWSQA